MVLALAVLALAPACERDRTSAPGPRGTPTVLDPATLGTIAGTVRATGPRPAGRRVPVTGDPTCAARHPDGVVVDAAAVDAAGGLGDAFVWIRAGLGERVFAVPTVPVVIDQRDCRFVPDVAGVRAGQTIEFRNDDPTLHNVHGVPTRSQAWNFGLGATGASRTLVLDEPETMVPVSCNVHSWMQAWIGVLDHPYFTVTAADGSFRLADVPAGAYTIAVWHPVLGQRETQVTVTAGETAPLELVYAAPSP